MNDKDQLSEEEIQEAAAEEPTSVPQHMPTHLPSGFDGVEPGKDRTLPVWLSVGPFPIRLLNGKTMFLAKVKLGDVSFEVEGSRNRAEGHWDVFLFENGKEIGASKFTVNYDCVLRIAVGMMRHYITRKFGRFAGQHGHGKFLARAIARRQEVK